VIDQLLLGLEPLRPADITDLIEGSPPQLVLKRLKCHPFAFLPAAGAV